MKTTIAVSAVTGMAQLALAQELEPDPPKCIFLSRDSMLQETTDVEDQ